MNRAERHLAHNQNQPTPFLDRHIRNSADQVVSVPKSDSSNCLHRTGANDDGIRSRGTGRDISVNIMFR
jgi:hypothetical protein